MQVFFPFPCEHDEVVVDVVLGLSSDLVLVVVFGLSSDLVVVEIVDCAVVGMVLVMRVDRDVVEAAVVAMVGDLDEVGGFL